MRTVLIALASTAALSSPALSQALVVDASTEEAFRASVQALVDQLPPEKQKEVGNALLLITTSAALIPMLPEGLGSSVNSADTVDRVMRLIDGKSAAEIVALANELVPLAR